jgi:hypothetical protein
MEQNRDIILPPISNYFDPYIRVNQNFVPQPLIPQQQAAAPTPSCPAGPSVIPDKMRVTRALRHHNNIQLLPPLSAIYKQ